jgi:arylsulfatase A-like enzyme
MKTCEFLPVYVTMGLVLFGTLSAACPASERTPASAPPNVILVMADDLGWGNVAYNRNEVVQTPHLDALAREGIRFDRFHAAGPVCTPTQASCLTGRHAARMNMA